MAPENNLKIDLGHKLNNVQIRQQQQYNLQDYNDQERKIQKNKMSQKVASQSRNINNIDIILGPDENESGLEYGLVQAGGKKFFEAEEPDQINDQNGLIVSSKTDGKYGIKKKLEAFKKDFSLF